MVKKTKISLNQERYLLAEKYTEATYALPVSHLIKGNIETSKLTSAIQYVIDNNDALRIKFNLDANGDIWQEVMADNESLLDYHSLNNPSTNEIANIISTYFYSKGELFDNFLTKFQLIKINNNEHIFTYSIHHSLADGITLVSFMAKLASAWNGNVNSPAQTTQYLDVLTNNAMLSISDERLHTFRNYWSSYLSEAQQANIPSDYISSDAAHEHKINYTHIIHSDIVAEVKSFAKTHNISSFNIFYLAYNVLIAKYSNCTDISTSYESSGRQNLDNANETLGLFSCAMVLRLQLTGESTIVELLSTLRSHVHNSIDHQLYPYHYIIKDSHLSPKHAINWYPKVLLPTMHGLTLESKVYVVNQSSFDFNLHCNQQGKEIHLVPRYNPSLFSKDRVKTLLQQFESLLKQIIAHPNGQVSDLKLVSEYDIKHQPDTSLALAPRINKRIYDGFINNVQTTPQNIAISYLNQQWTYKETDEISNKLGQLLVQRGLKPGHTVAILGLRCAAMVMAMLAVTREGGAFLVLDAAYPKARLESYWETSNPDFLIACGESEIVEELCFYDNLNKKLIQLKDEVNINDGLLAPFTEYSNHHQSIDPSSTAYYLFTSGTTGKPKCIATTHAPLAHFVDWQISKFNLSAQDKFTLLSGIGHDPVLRDVFTAFSAGAWVLIPSQETIFNPEKLYSWLLASQPTASHMTPAISQLMVRGYDDGRKLDSLKHLFIGGDKLEKRHVKSMVEIAPNATIINFYGTSETPQAMTFHQVDLTLLNEVMPIGMPISDTQTFILNNDLKPVGSYEIGQIAIRTKYLSEGYITDKKTKGLPTNSPYLSDIFSDETDTRIYLTGDYGFFKSDGNTVLIGRQDDQVKIRGFRIELSDINSHLKKLDGIDDALSLSIQDESSTTKEQRLVAYIISNPSGAIDTETIRQQLSTKLPNYMVPSYYVFLERLPLLPSGKVDRNKLPTPSKEHITDDATGYIENEKENDIINAWAKILGVDPSSISTQDSFTSLNGDSLSFIQASLVLEKTIGRIPDNWNSLTIKTLSEMSYESQLIVDVHTTVLLRAISIVLVVVGHFWLIFIKDATSALFIIAGYTFANFQIKSIQFQNNISPILKTMTRIAIPTFLVTLVHVLYRSDYSVSKLLFFDNFMGKVSPYWFIEVILQTLILFTLILSITRIRQYATNLPYRFGLILLSAGVALAVLTPHIWNPTDLNPLQLPHMKSWLFLFGWCLFYSVKKEQKAIFALLAAILPFIVYGNMSIIIFACSITLLYIPKVKLINPLHKLIYVIASSSLFIYITHIQTRAVLHGIGIDGNTLFNIMAGIAGGVFMHYAWSSANKVLSKTKNHPISLCKNWFKFICKNTRQLFYKTDP